MARIRSVKPEFWTDEKIVTLTPLARLLFIGMWNFVDDEGRAEFSPMRLKMQILPADSADVSELIGEIRRNSLIHVYEVDGKEYFQVRGFTKHQKIDKRRASKLPPPPTCADLRRNSPVEGIKEWIKERKEVSSGAGAPSDGYAFAGKVVRLNKPDFDAWSRAYSHLDLLAELVARDAWLSSDKATSHDRKNWYVSTSKYLANRNMEAKRGGHGSGTPPSAIDAIDAA